MTDANDKLPQTTERNPSPQPSSTESQTSFSSKIKNMNCSQVYIFIVNNFPLILYSITTILLFADQNLLAPNLTAIATEFGFTDIERDTKLGGDIAVAFFLLGAPASFIVGCLGDIYPRTPLFVLTVYIGEGGKFAICVQVVSWLNGTYSHHFLLIISLNIIKTPYDSMCSDLLDTNLFRIIHLSCFDWI